MSVKSLTMPEAVRIAGTLSEPNKMPGYAYGISALNCKLGNRLKQIPGSVCSHCYAMRNHYRRDDVLNVHRRRLASIKDPRWVDAMTTMISWAAKQRSRYFRWFDSGDLQSMRHLQKIVRIAERLPAVQFWLPTQEYHLVRKYLAKHGSFPSNLTVRLTAHMVDKPTIHPTLPTSVVHSSHALDPAPGVHYCPAKQQFNHCDDCRACWDPTVKVVAYPLH